MPKVVLGKTPEQLEAERAQKEREQEAEIQASILERQRKIQALHSKQKVNKVIITLIIILVAGILITFGTYNTFFKKGLTMDEVRGAIAQARYTDVFPSEGLDGYIRDNCKTLFKKYYNSNNANQGKDIKSVEVDQDSCYIFKVRKLSPTLAQVYFSVDIVTTKNDVMITDPNILEQLKRSGFGADLSTSVEKTTKTETIMVDMLDEEGNPVYETDEEGNTILDSDGNPIVKQVEQEVEVEEEEEPTDIPNTDIDYKLSKTGDTKHYYMTSNGTVMQTGDVIRERYSFYVPVKLAYQYDADGTTVVTTGFAVVGEMNLYSLVETDMTNFDEIEIDPNFAFNEDKKMDEDTEAKMRTKVNNTLKALYDGTMDTSQDFQNFRKFNNYNAQFVEINKFAAYSQPNALGYNVYVEYTIITSTGFKYKLATYMLVEQNGGTWVIKEFM